MKIIDVTKALQDVFYSNSDSNQNLSESIYKSGKVAITHTGQEVFVHGVDKHKTDHELDRIKFKHTDGTFADSHRKMLRQSNPIKEVDCDDEDQLDEISKDLAGRYIKKSEKIGRIKTKHKI